MPFDLRRARALALLAEAPHAEEMLTFYVAVLDQQRGVDEWLRERPPGWLGPFAPGGGRESAESLDERFAPFVEAVAADANPTLATAGAAILQMTMPERRALLDAFADANGNRPPGLDPIDHAPPPAPARFFARAFLEPVAVRARLATAGGEPTGRGSRCPFCGRRPVASTLSDADVQGRRSLVCGLCANVWPYHRATCVACGETRSDALLRHTDRDRPWLAVCECESCRTYVKEVDLRVRGTAEPVVEDLATPELDLWAVQRGLTRLEHNLLGV